MFLQKILENLYNHRKESLRICIKNAYDKEIGPHHSFLMRGAVKGVLYLLPDRDSFIKGLTDGAGIKDENMKYVLMEEQLQYWSIVTTYLKNFLKERNLIGLE